MLFLYIFSDDTKHQETVTGVTGNIRIASQKMRHVGPSLRVDQVILICRVLAKSN